MASTEIKLEITGGLAQIVLDGAPTRNSLDFDSVEQLIKACNLIDEDPHIGAAIITGVDKSFCSGAHTSVLESLKGKTEKEISQDLGRIYEAFTRVGELKVPTLAAVNGFAVGAGVNLAMVCDLRIGSENAVFNSGFAKLGIHPGGGHFNLIARNTSTQAASAMGLFAQKVTAHKAKEIGLLWDVFEAEKLNEIAKEMTHHLATDPQLARELVKSYRQTTSHSIDWMSALEAERARQIWTFSRSKDQG